MNEIQPVKTEQVFFDDIEAGSEIPPLIKGPYHVMHEAKFGAMIGDFYPGHYDHKWATERDRIPAAIVYGLQLAAHLSQLLTDWIGPNGALKKFSNQVRAQVFVGDTVTMKGKVTKKYSGDGENYLECEVWGEKQDGTVVIQGAATVSLPSGS